MLYLLYILIFLAIIHYTYEGILVPSFRLKIRFQLFKLRDDLRMLKAEQPQNVSDGVYRSLEEGINNQIRLLHRADIATAYQAHRVISKDPKLARLRDKRWEMLQQELNPSTKPIMERHVKLFALALLVNNGMVALYLLPIGIALVCGLFVGTLTSRFARSLMDIVFIPENQVDNVIPADRFAAV